MREPKELLTDTHAPRSQVTGCFWGCPFPEGLRAELSKACEIPGLTMTLLSVSNASADPRTGRPPALGAGLPTGLRSSAEGKRFRAPRVSYSHFQPCGSRTRRSCCNQSQDGPIVLARSRLLSPGSARPGRSWSPAPWLSPAWERVLRNRRHGAAEKTRNVGLLGLGSFALWFEATVKLLSSAHQGGRHIAKTQNAARSTAWLISQTSSECPGHASQETARGVPASPLPSLPQLSFLEFMAIGIIDASYQSQSYKWNCVIWKKAFYYYKWTYMLLKLKDSTPSFFQILKKQQKLQKEQLITLQKKIVLGGA